jgi:RNA polymerase sigma factor (sigma-70 family)
MAIRNSLSELSDQELINRIKDNNDYLGIIYTRCKSNSLSFMKKMTNGNIKGYDYEDVFHDATLALYENILKGDFILTVKFQTYLNSICRNTLLTTIKKSKLNLDYFEDTDIDDSPLEYKSSITDSLDDIDYSNEPLFLAIERAMESIKNSGGRCFDLLTQFWYKSKSMKELTEIFEYTNEGNTKNQKSRCQERLRILSYNELKNN